MKLSINQLRKQSTLIVLLISGFFLPLLTNLLSSWLTATIGNTPAQLLQIIAILIGLVVVLWVASLLLRQNQVQWLPVLFEELPERSPGLIVLVGPGGKTRDPLDGPETPAIEFHLGENPANPVLKVCWLITSSPGVPVANALKAKFEQRCMLEITPINDAFDIQETYEKILSIYRIEAAKYGLVPEQIISDFTGGTRPMSAGMVLACQEKYRMQYTTRMEGSLSAPKIVVYKPQALLPPVES